MTLQIKVEDNKQTGRVNFYSVGKSNNPEVNAAQVNLSRGGTRMFRLDNLDAHNGQGSAQWNDGASCHSAEAKAAYIDRVTKDIAAAIEAATAPKVSVIATVA